MSQEIVLPKKRTPRAKVVSSEDAIQAIFQAPPVVIEDTTPIEWDGTIPEPPIEWMKNHQWQIITDLDGLKAWWHSVRSDVRNHVPSAYDLINKTGLVHPKVGFDLETTGLDNRVVLGHSKTHIVGVCLAAYAPDGGAYSVVHAPSPFKTIEVPLKQCSGIYIPVGHKRWPYNLDIQAVMNVLSEIFRSSITVTANGKFDFLCLQAETPLITRQVPHYDWVETKYERQHFETPTWPFLEDVQTLMFLIDPDRTKKGGYGLKAISSEFLKQTQIEFEEITSTGVKTKGSRKMVLKTFDSVEPPKALHYAAADAINTLLLSDVLGYIREDLPFIHQLDTNTIDVQSWIEQQRPIIDRDYLNRESRFLELKCGDTLKKIEEIVGGKVNPDSTKNLGIMLFETMGLPHKGKTAGTKMFPEGNWKTDADTMEELASENPEIAIFDLIVKYRELRSAYPQKLFDGSEPLDSTAKFAYSATRTPSGRFACSGGDYQRDGGAGLNVQAVKALYATRYVPLRLLDLDSLKIISGLPEADMLSGDLIAWLKSNITEYNPIEYPGDEAPISDRNVTHLSSGITLPSIKNVSTVINKHIRLTPDGWVCLIHGCSDCVSDQAYLAKITYSPYLYDSSETMNLRRAFVAPPGWTFLSVDYSAIELRMVANFSNEPLWVNGFNGGTDLHASMAEALFGDRFRNGDPATKSHLRSQSKTITFGNLYGGTSRTIQQNLNEYISIDEAKQLYANWIGAIPSYKAWVQGQAQSLRQHSIVRTALGRQRPLITEMQSGDKPTIAYAERTSLNHPAQGTSADILRLALARIKEWIHTGNLSDVVNIFYHVHDEIDFVVKDEWVPFVVPSILNIMKCEDIRERFNWAVPLECDVEYGSSWDVKFKFEKQAWTGVQALKTFDQSVFRTLFEHISSGANFSVDDYRTSFLPAIYKQWSISGYKDPYQQYSEDISRKAQKFSRWMLETPAKSKWPELHDLLL